jgi:WD40 repeat protein
MMTKPVTSDLFYRVAPEISGGIPQDLLSENHRSMGTELVCMICLEIVLNPVMCSKCENLFCKDCIDRLLQKSNKCPNLCNFIEKEKNIMLKKILNKIEFKCIFNKSGCLKIIPYSEFLNHIKDCEFGNFGCNSPGCEYFDIKTGILTHIETCDYREFECSLCNNFIAKHLFDAHTTECENKSIVCKFCYKFFQNKLLKSHMENCDEYEITCEECETEVKRKFYAEHDKINCLTNQVTKWKTKCKELQKRNDELEAKLIDGEKLNKNIVNLSAKLLEKPYSLSNSQYFTQNNQSASDLAVYGSSSNFYNNNIRSAVNSSNYNTNPLPALGNLQISQNNYNLNQENDQYTTVVKENLRGLSGLVYAIIDLEKYEADTAACGNFSSILIFRVSTCTKISTLEGHSSYIWSLVHLEDYNKNFIASGSQDNTIKIWDLSTMSCVKSLDGHSNWVTTVTTLKKDKAFLLSSSYDHTVRVWNIDSGSCVKKISNVFGKFCANAWYADPAYILHGSSGNNIVVYNFDTDTIVKSLKGHTNLINCFLNLGEFRQDLIASGSDDKTIKIWNMSNGICLTTLFGHTQCITFLHHLFGFNSANNLIASGSDDHTIRIWSLDNYECVSIIKIHESWVKSMLHMKSPNNCDKILSHGDTGVIKLIQLQRKEN